MTGSATEQTAYDVIVIGAGPVGEVCADRVHRGGLSVALVERRLFGGECSYYACSPSKALLRPIHATHASNRVEGSEGARIEVSGVLHRRDIWINNLDDSGQIGWAEHAGLVPLRGEARITGERTVEVDGTTYRAAHAVVVATGSSPAVPNLPGLRDAAPWTNIEATTSHTVPERLVVLGGGVVACELATVYAALGSQVTIVEMAPRLLGRTEDFAGEAVRKALEEAGVTILLDAKAERVERPTPGGPVTLHVAGGQAVEGDELLCAVGRTPNSRDLGLEAVGAALNDQGYLSVDERMTVPGVRTPDGAPWLYGVGDVVGIALLTHMGKYQARACGDLIAARAAGRDEDDPAFVPYATRLGSPQVVFTDPEVSAVGLTASEAQERGIRTRVVDVPMDAAAGAGLQAEGYQGQARIVVDEDRGVIVGCTFVGQDVAELVHAATIAVVGEVPLTRLWHAVPSFPTMSEIWLRLLEEYGL